MNARWCRGLLLAFLSLAGCGDAGRIACGGSAPREDEPGTKDAPPQRDGRDALTDPSTGRLRITVTDAPCPLEFLAEAKVTFSALQARRLEAEEAWLELLASPREIDLLALQNGVKATLLEASVPPGTYDAFRLVIARAHVRLTDGREFELAVPSGMQSGIKLFPEPPIVVVGGLSAELLLDLDLSRSFVVQGNPRTAAGVRGIQFKPVLRVANESCAGRIAGTTYADRGTAADPWDDTPVAGVLVTVERDGEVVATTVSGEAGEFAVLGLSPGDYAVTATRDGYQEATAAARVIVANVTAIDSGRAS